MAAAFAKSDVVVTGGADGTSVSGTGTGIELVRAPNVEGPTASRQPGDVALRDGHRRDRTGASFACAPPTGDGLSAATRTSSTRSRSAPTVGCSSPPGATTTSSSGTSRPARRPSDPRGPVGVGRGRAVQPRRPLDRHSGTELCAAVERGRRPSADVPLRPEVAAHRGRVRARLADRGHAGAGRHGAPVRLRALRRSGRAGRARAIATRCDARTLTDGRARSLPRVTRPVVVREGLRRPRRPRAPSSPEWGVGSRRALTAPANDQPAFALRAS